ncbi:hypothetical protein PMAYCL1PPCAC_04882, partial [Pristionchus mayeri]
MRMRIVTAISVLFSACEGFDAYSAKHPSESLGEAYKVDLQSELNALLQEVHPALFFRPDTKSENLIDDAELNDVSDVGDITRHELVDDSTAPIKSYESRVDESDAVKLEGGANESILPTTTARLIVFAKKRRRPTIVFPREDK